MKLPNKSGAKLKIYVVQEKNHINSSEENNSEKKEIKLFVGGLCLSKNGFIFAIIIMYVGIVRFCVL